MTTTTPTILTYYGFGINHLFCSQKRIKTKIIAVRATICDIENCDLIFLLHTKALNHGDSFIQRLLFDMLQFVLLLKVMKKPH